MRSFTWFSPGRSTRTAIAITCGQAFFLFGYDQGVFGGLITNSNFLDTIGHPAPGLLGIIVSIYNLGCLFGCVLNFIWGERLGRRMAIMSAMVFIAVGAVIQASSYGVPQLMFGRFITGKRHPFFNLLLTCKDSELAWTLRRCRCIRLSYASK